MSSPIASELQQPIAAEGTADNSETGSNAGDTKVKAERDFTWPQPTDYPARTVGGIIGGQLKPKYTAKPFEDGVNITSALAEIRARHARNAAEEAEELCKVHAASGMWPNGTLKVIFGSAHDLQIKSAKLTAEALAAFEKSKSGREERSAAKQAQLGSLKGELSQAMTDVMFGPGSEGKDINALIPLGVAAVLAKFTVWAPKVNSWSEPVIAKAIGLAEDFGIKGDDLKEILAAAPKEEEKTESKSGKRKAEGGDTDTPKKAKGESSAAGSQKPAHAAAKGSGYRISKKGAASSAAAAIEEAAPPAAAPEAAAE